MRCVKTGITFQVPVFREDTFHGDMFFNTELGIYLIRGIAQETSDVFPQIILSPLRDAFMIDSVEDSFAEKFLQMNDHDLRLDIGDPACVLIDDTRFFI